MYASVYNNIQPGIQNAFIALTHMIPDDPCKSNMCLNDGTSTKEVFKNRCSCNDKSPD